MGVMDDVDKQPEDVADGSAGVPRQRLFEPGKYSSLPNVILADPALPASAKLVWMALVRHLQDASVSVWPSMARLAMLTGISRDTAMQSVARLEARGLVVIERVFGRPSTYRILQPDAGSAAAYRSETPTGRKTRPAGNPDRTGRKNQPPPVGKPDTKYSSKYSKNNSPLTPRDAGGDGVDVSPAEVKAAENLASASLAKEPKTAEEAVERIDAAWLAVVGLPLGSKYRRRIKRGWERGDRPWLELIDVAAVEGSIAMAARAKGTHGFDWLRKHIEAAAAVDVKQNAAKRSRSSQQQAAEQAALEAQEAAEEAAMAAARRGEYFETLSDERREGYRVKVRSGRFAPKRASLIEAQAAMAAWDEREREREVRR